MIKPEGGKAEKCLLYRMKAKRGEYLRPEESKFCEKMLKEYPEWYKSIDKLVFEKTKPFGAI